MRSEKYRSGLHFETLSIVLLTFGLALAGCMTKSSAKVAPPPVGGNQPTAAAMAATTAMTTALIKGADTAYYFDIVDDQGKLVAVEALDGKGRQVEISKLYANEDGTSMVMKSSCQTAMPAFEGETEMVGKAKVVVYAVTGPSVLIVLGVEDLSHVTSRMINPMKPLAHDDVPICNCALRRCGPALCCPC
jgi:hypothetical protein